MKKLLALTLALVLACSLCVPALAAEGDDYGFTVNGEPAPVYVPGETPPMVLDESDAVDAYIAAHPEEMAALDVDALLEGWGYLDPVAAFLADYGVGEDGDVTQAVKEVYAANRLDYEEIRLSAEAYKAEHPDVWESFDPEVYLMSGKSYYYYDYDSKEALMAEKNLLTQEELALYLFDDYMEYVYPEDWKWNWDDPGLLTDAELIPTLVVNGVASDVTVTAGEGVTYADAAALRGILGVKAVAPTYEGPVPIREAAENAGWDVEWYDAGWGDRQVCLWNKDAFVAEVKAQTEPFQKLWDAAMELSRNTLFTETPQRATQTATVTFKRFNSLDGDKTYTLRLRAESVWQKGVVDCTVTFDVSQLLGMFTAAELESAAKDAQLSLADLKTLFSAGKAEFIIDYSAGGMAYNIPLLGLVDEDLADWQGTYFPGLTEAIDPEGGLDLAASLYENMVGNSNPWMDGVERRANVDDTLAALGIFAGADNVQVSGGSVTYTLETDKVNAALSKLVGDGTKTFSFFKKCDINMNFNTQGKTGLALAFRLDTDGIVEAAMADGDMTNALAGGLMRWLLGSLDMELTANVQGDPDKAAETVKLHIKNFGTIEVNTQSTTKSAAQGPRQLAEVERTWVEPPADGTTVTAAG